ncbi:MAG: hypothetical protein ACTHJM_05390 [Marmoricola sp.]
MGGRSEDKGAAGKPPRPEPNLELPSFRLRRKKKPEPSVLTPEPSVERIVEAHHRLAPPPPPASAHKVPPPPGPATAHTPPPPPQQKLAPPPPAPRPPAPPAPEAEAPAKPAKEPKAPKAAKEPKPPKPAKQPKPPKAPKPKRERSTAPFRWLPGYLSAIVVGALCGALTVLLAWATGRGCAELRGVGTCGGYGVFALVAILGIDVVIATSLLRLCRVIDPATTAMLGVGLVAVLAMLFFLDQTQSFAMVYVIPILMAATFTFAWWITKAIAERVED